MTKDLQTFAHAQSLTVGASLPLGNLRTLVGVQYSPQENQPSQTCTGNTSGGSSVTLNRIWHLLDSCDGVCVPCGGTVPKTKQPLRPLRLAWGLWQSELTSKREISATMDFFNHGIKTSRNSKAPNNIVSAQKLQTLWCLCYHSFKVEDHFDFLRRDIFEKS